jgi:biotin carboxylase
MIQSKKKRLLILGAGEMQIPIIQKSMDMGIYTIVADIDPNAPGMALADEIAIISTIDLEKVLILSIDKKINGILTTSDYPVNTVAKVANQLNLKGMSVIVAELCTNKFLQREFFKINNIKTPKYRLIANNSELDEINHFPSIIKPIDSSASRGVKKLNNKDELNKQYNISKSFSKQAKVIIEDYIEGVEFSVESITQNGQTSIIAITEKQTKGEEMGFFVEDTHIIPARINKSDEIIIKKEVLKAIKLLQIDNCPTHTEVKLNSNGAYIIEIACRLGGDYITSDLVKLSTGIDMLEILINISLGKNVDISKKISKVAAIQFLNSNNYFKCKSFIESDNKNIVRSKIKKLHNEVITNSMERMGYIILQSNTTDEINFLLNQIQ